MFLYLHGVELGGFDVDDTEIFMNDVAINGELDIDYIAGELAAYAASTP